jgi:hypothetical protein
MTAIGIFIILFILVIAGGITWTLLKVNSRHDKTKDKEQLDFINKYNKNKS